MGSKGPYDWPLHHGTAIDCLSGRVLSFPGFGWCSRVGTIQIIGFHVPVTLSAQCNYIIESVGILWIIKRPDRLDMMHVGLVSDFFAGFSTNLALMIVSI